ncbi:hypothetical protein BDK61_2987 [Haloarcula quadrata]|jgi:hypothetical protein|uniref:Uncharacterized protein n=2 Tax=Haloarcula TaxID=2237 RepID=Q5V167_HALMA|nr:MULTISPECIES: hypothetical protein [Haloarcula]AAV46736.1 unknown [Haloarcula marismortui ATCC 43049]QCP91447.1 hypothetical protein E6P14_11515 [Haloarcula marismortui ATCC 43049]RKS83599.1 hypothetical protein BDK61_2987 [Haloarcula quadrata]
MSPSSDSGTTEPVAVLVAVFAVTLGVSLYAGVLDDAFGTLDDDRNIATPTADAVEQRLSSAGVVRPKGLDNALDAVPANYHGNATITAMTGERWSGGREPPTSADTETRTVSVQVGPGTVRRGTLTVRVWR